MNQYVENMIKKRAIKNKPKIKSCEKMRTKLKDRFLPPPYLQDSYSSFRTFGKEV